MGPDSRPFRQVILLLAKPGQPEVSMGGGMSVRVGPAGRLLEGQVWDTCDYQRLVESVDAEMR